MEDMNIREMLFAAAQEEKKRGLPILSFPATQKLGVSVEELVQSAPLQAEVMALIARETDTLAAISLMDLSVEAEAFGAQVRFSQNEVPAVLGQLISCEEEADAIEIPALDAGRIPVFVDAIRLAKAKIPDKPLLAGMIGPYSLAGRLMDVTEIIYTCYDEPETVHKVLDKATKFLIDYGNALKAAGADGLMLAEPLAGIISPELAAEFSMPYVKRLIQALQTDHFAVIYHNCGNAVSSMLEGIFAQGAAAYHFGNAVEMEAILKAAPENVLCMGNVDPVAQFVKGTQDSMTLAVQDLMRKCGGYSNFLPSSGCDIPAHASWENIEAFFRALS